LEVDVGQDGALLVRLVECEVVVHEELSQWVGQVRVKIKGRVRHFWRDQDLLLGDAQFCIRGEVLASYVVFSGETTSSLRPCRKKVGQVTAWMLTLLS